MILYVGLVLLVAAAVPTMLWLKREGDRHWREHERMRAFAAPYVQLQIVLRDELTPALIKMAESIRRTEPAFRRFGEELKKFGA